MIGGFNSLGVRTHEVGLVPSIQAAVKRVNRAGIVVRVRASDFTQPLGRMSAKADEFTKSLEASNARVIAFGASAAIIGGVTTAFSQLVIQATKVEKILADINAVLGTSAENLEKFGDGLFNVARNTSQGLEVAAEAALEFSRQGLSMEETLKRTNDALILTRLTGLAAADSVKGLTAAVNGFADAGLSTTEIINKLAAVDVKFAVSADDLINALARAGAVAQDAGVDFDKLVGAVTSAQQITARGGAVIGNSFKTIFTRLQRSSTLDRLEELGIAVRDLQGETLPALTILQQLSKSYDTLGAATKAAVAEQVGGVFQINILKAALKDLSKENSLYAQATETSASASNEAYEKNALLQKTLSSIATQTLTTVKELTANLGELTIAPALKTFLDNINGALQVMSDLFGADKGESIGSDFAQGLARAVGGVLSGPGMFGLVMIFGKLFGQAFKFAKNSVKDLLQIKSIKDQELAIQESIVDAMLSNVELQKTLLRLDGDQLKQEQLVLGVLQDQTNLLEKQRNIAAKIAPGLRQAGVQPNLIVDASKNQGATSRTTKSSGHIPTPIEEMKERAGAKQGGYIAGPVATMSIPKLGRVVYNKNETVKQFDGMSQPAIMPPEKSKAGKEYKNDFSTQHGFDPYSHDSFSAGGFIPNYSFPTMNQNRLRDSRSRNRGVKPLNLEYFYPSAGTGSSTIFKLYKDIVRSADSGQPYTNILAGEIIGPRIPKMIVEGKRMLDRARSSGKKIPKMSIQGTIYPSMLTRKVDQFASDRKNGYIHAPIDYILEEEGEVRKYLKMLGVNPESHDAVKLQNVYKGGYNTGFIPSFALKAELIPGTNILRLPTAKMINETTASDFKGNKIKGWQTLEATVDNVQKYAQTYRNELSELKKVGVDILQRKMYFSNQSQHIPVKDRKNIARQQKKMKSMKGFAGRNQHKITGNSQEDALFKSSLKDKGYYPTWTGAYTSKGRQEGKGDENFKVDFFAPGRKPIESKYGKYTAPNLIAKSIRLYSDSYIEEFLSRSGRSDLSENMRKGKLKDSTNMLTSLGYKDVNADTVLGAGLFNGYLPDRKNNVQQNLRTVKELEDRETLSGYSAMSSSEMFDRFSSNSDKDFPRLEKMSKYGIQNNRNKKSRKKYPNYNLEPEGFYHQGVVPNFSRNWAQGKSKSSDKNQGRKRSPQSEVIKAIRATLSKRGIKRSAMAEDKILFAAEKYMTATKSRDLPGGYVNINGNKINLNEITLALKKQGDYHPSFQDTVEFDGSKNHKDNLMFEELDQKRLPNFARYGMSSFRSPIMFKNGNEGSFGRSYLATTSKSGKLFLLKDGHKPFSDYMKKMGKPEPKLKEGTVGGREGYWVNSGADDVKTWAELPNTKLLASQEKRRVEAQAIEDDRKARLNPGVFDPVLSNGKIFFSDGSSGSVNPDFLSKKMGKEYKHVEVDKRALYNYAKENKITKKIGGTESAHLGSAFNKILSLPRSEFLKMKHIIRPRMQTDKEKDVERKMNAPSRPIKWDVRDNQKGKKQFNLKADDTTFRQFAKFLLDQGVPKRSVDNIHKALANKQAHLDAIVKEAKDKRSMGRGRGVFFDAAKKQESFEKGFSIPTDGLFIKNLNKMVSDFNKTVYNSDGFIPNFANKVYDRDKIQPGIAGDILNKILSNRKKKNLLLGPSGVGKTTMAAKYGSFIQNLEDAQTASSYTILSGAAKTKKGGVSPALQNIINAVNQSGGTVSYLSSSDKVLDERRDKRIAQPLKGDLRSLNQLKGTKYAPKHQPDFISNVKKLSARFQNIQASNGFVPNFMVPFNIIEEGKAFTSSILNPTSNDLKIKQYKNALQKFLNYQKKIKNRAWNMKDFAGYIKNNEGSYPNIQHTAAGHSVNIIKGKSRIYHSLAKSSKPLLEQFVTGLGKKAHSQSIGAAYEKLIEDNFGVQSLGHNAPIDYKNLGQKVNDFKKIKDPSGNVIDDPEYTLLTSTTTTSPVEAAAGTGHTKPHMGRKGPRFAVQQRAGSAAIKNAIVSSLKDGQTKKQMPLTTGTKRIVELAQKGKSDEQNLSGYDPKFKAFQIISTPSDTALKKTKNILRSMKGTKQVKDKGAIRDRVKAQKGNNFNINLFGGYGKSAHLVGSENMIKLEREIEQAINNEYKKQPRNKQAAFIKNVKSASENTFEIKYNKDVLDLKNHPITKSHGHIPNFAAWNPLTKNTQSIAKQGGLATNKFALAKIIQNSPFKDLLRKHNHWNNFPEKHKKRLNQWLKSQGYTNRALQAWGLLSKHSKSIASGVSDFAAHYGHIPNFSNPLTEAISREKHALREQGSSADIYIDQDNRLKNPKNPAGLLVANTRDEPKSGSQGVNRAISMGMDPKTHGASSGVIPNFQKSPSGSSPTNNVSKQMKETGDASSDLMMKMMGLTTITYALQGAMGEAEEEASNFRKGMNMLNAAVMGISQAMMVSMIVPKGKFAEGKQLYTTARDKSTKTPQNSSTSAKLGAKAGKASMMAKGAGGMLMGMLGPIGIAASILIPVITALTENFDMFKGATELATRDLENLQKGLSKLENASSAAASLRDTSSRIIELEQKSGSRSISQQKEYYKLKHEEMKQQNKLNTAVNQAIASYSLKDGSNKESVEVQTLLNGSYEEQIEVLQRMQLAQQKLINMATNRKNLAEDLDRAGAQDFSMFSFGGTDELKNYKGILETGAIDLLSSFGTNYKNLSQEDLNVTISELKNLRNDLDRGEGYQTDDFDKSSLKIISQGLTKGQNLNSLEIARLTNNLADSLAGVGKGVDRTFAGDQDRIPQAVRMFIDTMITGIQEAGNSAQKGESTKKENDLVFSTNLRSRDSNFLDEQNFLLKRDIELMKTRVDLEEKSLDLQRQENDLYNKELPSMFGLLTKDEEIDRKYDSELKAVDDKLAANISRNNIDANASIDKALEDLMQPEDFAQALFNKQKGFQEGNLTLLQALLSATLNSQEKEKFEEKKSAKIKDLTKEYQDTSKAISEPGYASDLEFNAMLSGASPGAKKLGLKTFEQAKQESYNQHKRDNDYSSGAGNWSGVTYGYTSTVPNMDSDSTILKNLVKENEAKLRELMVDQGGMSDVAFDSKARKAKSSFNKEASSDKNVKVILDALKGQDMSPKVEKLISLKQNITEEQGKEFYSRDNILNNSINAGLNVKTKQSEPSSLDGSSGQQKSIQINIDKLNAKLERVKGESSQLAEEVQGKDKDLKTAQTIEATTEGQQPKPKTPDSITPITPPTTQPITQPIDQPTSAQVSIDTDTFQFNALEKLSGTSKDDLNTPDITNQVNELVGSFGSLISDLLKNQEGVANKDGQLEKSLSPAAFSATLKKVVGSIKTPEVKLALIDQLEESGVISNMTEETQKVIAEIRKTLINTKDNNSEQVEKSKQEKRIINLKRLEEKIQKRTNKGFDEAQKFISGYKDINGDLLKVAQDDLSGRLKWAGLDETLAQIGLSNAKTLRDTGQIYETARAESEKSLTNKLTANITEIETLRAQNDSRDATEKGLALAEDSFKKKSEENRATQIELNNKLKLSNLSEILYNQVTQESDIKTKQLILESKSLAARQKLYETTEALAEEVKAELAVQRQKDYNAGLRSDQVFEDKSEIIRNREDPFYGMTGFEADATIRQGNTARTQRDQIAAARADYELYTGRGNELRASDARLQMLQIQKQQNIEQGNGSLFSDTIAVRIAETNVELERFGETLGNITFDTVQQGLKDVVAAMGDSTKSMKDVFLGFAGHIANAIGDALLDRATKQVTSGLMGLLGFDDISQNYNGGLIKGYASGGTTSKAPAMLTAGEYVVRKKVVDRLGISSLDKMNKTGDVDDSLSELYSKPNNESFDMSTEGSASIPPIMRFNEGGRLNAAISSITSPIAKFFSGGGFSNPFAPADDSSNMMKFAKGAGYVGGSSLAQYENREPVQTSGPTAPIDPGQTMLNTSSALNIDPTGRMMSARYRSTDSYSQQYGDYLLAKYQADVDAKNQKVMNKANEAAGILGKFTGAMIGHGVSQGITALSALKTTTGGFKDWNSQSQELNIQKHMRDKGINNAADLQSKSSALFNASYAGGNIGRENKLSRSQYAASLDMSAYAGETDFSRLNNFELSKMRDRGSQGFFGQHNRDVNFNAQKPMDTRSESSMQRELDILGKEVGALRKQSHPSYKGNMLYTSSKNYGVSPRAFTPEEVVGQDARLNSLQKLKSKSGMSTGGRVYGPSGRDQVGPVMLDRGEYVIRASSVNNIEKKYPGFFDKLNSMKMNAGGPVDPNAQVSKSEAQPSAGGGVTVNINVSSSGQASIEGGDSSDQAFGAKIKEAVVQVINQEKRVGGSLSGK